MFKIFQKKIFYVIVIFVVIFCLYFKLFKIANNNYPNGTIDNLKINKAFVINLDGKPARWQKTKENLLKIGLNENQIERFSATYGLKVRIYDYKNKKTFQVEDLVKKKEKLVYGNIYEIKCSNDFSFDYKYQDDMYFPENKRHFRPGEFGCLCSHLRILKEGLKRNYNNILIFEDDIAFVNDKLDFNKKLLEIGKYLPKDFQLLHLGSTEISFRVFKNNQEFKPKKKKKQFVNKMSDFYNLFQGNYALLFSKDGMKVFLNKSKRIKTLAADILYPKISMQEDNTYFLNEDLFYPYRNYSSTDGDGENAIFNKIIVLDTGKNKENLLKIKLMLKNTEFFNFYKIVPQHTLYEEIKHYNQNKKIIIIKDNFTIKDNFNFGYFLDQQYPFRWFFNTYFDVFMHINDYNNRQKPLFPFYKKKGNNMIECYRKSYYKNINDADISLWIIPEVKISEYLDYIAENNSSNVLNIISKSDNVCFYK